MKKPSKEKKKKNVEDKNLPIYYVAIGASAGGLEAIDTFFKYAASEWFSFCGNSAFISGFQKPNGRTSLKKNFHART
ncbi:MAG: hypothetical protein IPL26_14510 [Leptospiraceae bacterium]|nr:hypothetical protein [Leptospiraceae bacterium]